MWHNQNYSFDKNNGIYPFSYYINVSLSDYKATYILSFLIIYLEF